MRRKDPLVAYITPIPGRCGPPPIVGRTRNGGSNRLSVANLAANLDEKLWVTSALADVPEPGSLKLLAACLDDATSVDAPSVAAVKVASALDAIHKDAVAPVLQQVLRVCKNAEVQKQARETLTKLGVQSE